MPFTFNDDGTFATVPEGDTGRRVPTQANLDELGGGGGSGVTVDNTVDAPFAASTLIAPGATESGAGEATLAVAVLKTTVVITDAQIKALPTTPVEIVPAPGAGNVVLPLFTLFLPSAAFTTYTNVDPDSTLELAIAGASWALLINSSADSVEDVNTVLGNGERVIVPVSVDWRSTHAKLASVGPVPKQIASGGINAAANVDMINGSGDLTGGAAGNTLKVTMLYVVVALT